jgi:hypothetical protein
MGGDNARKPAANDRHFLAMRHGRHMPQPGGIIQPIIIGKWKIRPEGGDREMILRGGFSHNF